jgi:hypothetical protein
VRLLLDILGGVAGHLHPAIARGGRSEDLPPHGAGQKPKGDGAGHTPLGGGAVAYWTGNGRLTARRVRIARRWTSDLFVRANHVAVSGVRVLAVRKLKLASRLVVQRLLVGHVGVDVGAHGFDHAVCIHTICL